MPTTALLFLCVWCCGIQGNVLVSASWNQTVRNASDPALNMNTLQNQMRALYGSMGITEGTVNLNALHTSGSTVVLSGPPPPPVVRVEEQHHPQHHTSYYDPEERTDTTVWVILGVLMVLFIVLLMGSIMCPQASWSDIACFHGPVNPSPSAPPTAPHQQYHYVPHQIYQSLQMKKQHDYDEIKQYHQKPGCCKTLMDPMCCAALTAVCCL